MKSLLSILTLGATSWGIGCIMQDAEPPAHESVRRVMIDLAGGLRGAEEGLETSDDELFRTSIARLAKGAESLARAPMSADAAQPGREFLQLARALAEHGPEGAVADRRAWLDELRASCVACHETVRAPMVEGRMFPARRTLVAGRVRLESADGAAREDASRVVVFLDGVAPRTLAHPLVKPRIRQKDRQFSPRVLPVVRGTEVAFPNDDAIYHNVFSLSKCCSFDLDAYGEAESRSVRFDEAGLVRIYCNIHPEMSASVLVLNNSWFAVTDAEGRFRIPEVPKGNYTLRTWNALGAVSRRPIEVDGVPRMTVDVEVREKTARRSQHKNKFGRAYRRKY